jgi:hypothetical protein
MKYRMLVFTGPVGRVGGPLYPAFFTNWHTGRAVAPHADLMLLGAGVSILVLAAVPATSLPAAGPAGAGIQFTHVQHPA